MSSGAATVRQWARDVKRFADDWPAQGGELLQRAVDAQLRADTGDGTLSRGRDLGRATTELTTGPGEAEVVAAGSAAVWGILQGGAQPHDIVAARGRLLRTPQGPRPRVAHPGAPARRTFTEGAERGLAAAQRDMETVWARVGG